MQNLLSNAIKFSREGTIRVTGKVLPALKNLILVVTVDDEGIGMSEYD